MNFSFTETERESLRARQSCMQLNKSHLILYYDTGVSYMEIARRLLVNDETIQRYIQPYQQEHRLKSNNGGNASSLTPEQTEPLNRHLQEKIFGIKYSVNVEQMVHFLHHLRQHHGHSKTIHLMLEHVSYHRSNMVKETAEPCNISLHFFYSLHLNPMER